MTELHKVHRTNKDGICECGKRFPMNIIGSPRRYCSEKCARRAQNRRNYQRNQAARRAKARERAKRQRNKQGE